MSRIYKAIPFLLIMLSCEYNDPLYQHGELSIYGKELAILTDIKYDQDTREVIVFNQLQIENNKYDKRDYFEGYYAIKRNEYHSYLYLIDSFPVGKNWRYKMVEVLSWTLNNVETATQILDHSKITDTNIEELIEEIENVKAGNQIKTSQEMSLFLKKLYILNLRCCLADDNRMIEASKMLSEIEMYQKLDFSNKKLKILLLSFLKNPD